MTTTNSPEAQPRGEELSLERRVTLLVDAAINQHNELSVGSYGELIHGLVRLIEQQATRADLPRATTDEVDRELIETIAEPWICVEEKPCEEAVAVHWEEMMTALVAGLNRARATGETTVEAALVMDLVAVVVDESLPRPDGPCWCDDDYNSKGPHTQRCRSVKKLIAQVRSAAQTNAESGEK